MVEDEHPLRSPAGQPGSTLGLEPGLFRGHFVDPQTGAAWRFLPDEFPSPSTCWRRLKPWEDEGVWLNGWRTLLGALDEEGRLPGSRKSRFRGPKAVRGKSRKE